MSVDNDNQLHNNDDLSQDTQNRWCEIISPIQVLTGEQHIVKTNKKKRHGNRKLRHFKQKCRAHGLSEEEITTLIRQRNHSIISEKLLNDETTIHEQIKESNKRKRDECSSAAAAAELFDSSIKSLSQLSISQEERAAAGAGGLKKMKNSTPETMSSSSFSNNDNDNTNRLNQDDSCTLYKPSKYLRMPRKLLLHSLHFQLNNHRGLKWKKKEQRFILSRLELFDRQFYLDQIRDLYQFYFDQGLKYQIWPKDILKIIASNEPNIIQKYLEDYLILLENRINQYKTELTIQSLSCPVIFITITMSLEMIDQRLHEFVRLHHLDLSL